MDQGVKIAVACSVLFCGLVVALLFRHESPRTRPPVSGSADRLVLRRATGPSPGSRVRGHGRLERADDAAPAAPGRPNIVTPMDPTYYPPVLARTYPRGGASGTPRWGTSIPIGLPRATRPGESVRTHKIVDGDTLQILAKRYLGSAERWMEIYEANHDVLPSPQILPIAVNLKIPPRRREDNTSAAPANTAAPANVPAASNAPYGSEVMPKRPLVPISRRRQ